LTTPLKTISYVLTIYAPGSNEYVAAKYDSTSPFVAIREGDYLHPFPRPDGSNGWPELSPNKYLRATEVHHTLSDPEEEERITHMVEVYTELYEEV
jgi:hypothetical protein